MKATIVLDSIEENKKFGSYGGVRLELHSQSVTNTAGMHSAWMYAEFESDKYSVDARAFSHWYSKREADYIIQDAMGWASLAIFAAKEGLKTNDYGYLIAWAIAEEYIVI